MKYAFTLFFVVAGYATVHAQGTIHREIGMKPLPTVNKLPSGGIPVTIKLPAPPMSAETHKELYRQNVSSGDARFNARDFGNAILFYKEALTHYEDPYPRSQISKAEVELAKIQKEKDEKAAQERYILTHSVHFSGRLMEDKFSFRSSEIYVDDDYSEILPAGQYDTLGTVLKESGNENNTLDGLTVPPGMRLIIYSEPNLKGTIVLDITGPAIVNNGKWENSRLYKSVNTCTFQSAELQATYPPHVRLWSATDMHGWTKNGSMEIIAVE